MALRRYFKSYWRLHYWYFFFAIFNRIDHIIFLDFFSLKCYYNRILQNYLIFSRISRFIGFSIIKSIKLNRKIKNWNKIKINYSLMLITFPLHYFIQLFFYLFQISWIFFNLIFFVFVMNFVNCKIANWGFCSFSLILLKICCVFSSGFDEYMNIVLDEAEEVNIKTQHRNKVGRIMLKGDNITLIQGIELQSWFH